MVYPIPKLTLIPLSRLWIKEINGMENIPVKGGFIISANHASYMDHFCLGNLIVPRLNKKLHFLAKKEHFDSWFQRWWHKYGGAIPLDRKKGGKAALKWAIKALKEGKIIGIYPEGTRTLTGKLQEAKTGVARLALAARVPVVPVGLIGNFEILPKGKYIPKLKRATVNVGKPMRFEKYYKKKVTGKILREITTKIMKGIARLSNKQYNFK
jgi:1-acyl-sn-glycerol-3-phosphate acyltransferase